MTRTRFAPSPSGYMHVGNLRSALFAYLLAKHDSGEFILRLEDTDQNHYEVGAEEFIYQVLNDFQLICDEGPKNPGENGPYIQSERMDIYKTYAEKLVKSGFAYYCFCDRATLLNKRIEAQENKNSYMYDGTCRDFPKDEAMRRIAAGEKYVIRQKVLHEGQMSFKDLVYGDVTLQNQDMEDQILIKSDGMPTYNFANVVDDALMGISHVTRGVEYLSSTPKYLLLYDALGFPRPEFVHLPHVLKEDKTKFSKRNRDADLRDLLKHGFLPEAILNYIVFLGWSPKSNREFFSLEELVQVFSIEAIHKRPATFSMAKLKWFNRHYISEMEDVSYLQFVRPYLEAVYNLDGISEEWISTLLLTFKNRISFGAEIGLVTHLFFASDVEYDEDCIRFLQSDVRIKHTVEVFKEEVKIVDEWEKENIQNLIIHVGVKANVTGEMLYMPIRVAMTGSMQGIDLVTTLYLLGKEMVLERLGE